MGDSQAWTRFVRDCYGGRIPSYAELFGDNDLALEAMKAVHSYGGDDVNHERARVSLALAKFKEHDRPVELRGRKAMVKRAEIADVALANYMNAHGEAHVLVEARKFLQMIAAGVAPPRGRGRKPIPHYRHAVKALEQIGFNRDDARLMLRACGVQVTGPLAQ